MGAAAPAETPEASRYPNGYQGVSRQIRCGTLAASVEAAGGRSLIAAAEPRHISISLERKRLVSVKHSHLVFVHLNRAAALSVSLLGTDLAYSQNGFAVEIAGEREGNEQPSDLR